MRARILFVFLRIPISFPSLMSHFMNLRNSKSHFLSSNFAFWIKVLLGAKIHDFWKLLEKPILLSLASINRSNLTMSDFRERKSISSYWRYVFNRLPAQRKQIGYQFPNRRSKYTWVLCDVVVIKWSVFGLNLRTKKKKTGKHVIRKECRTFRRQRSHFWPTLHPTGHAANIT